MAISSLTLHLARNYMEMALKFYTSHGVTDAEFIAHLRKGIGELHMELDERQAYLEQKIGEMDFAQVHQGG